MSRLLPLALSVAALLGGCASIPTVQPGERTLEAADLGLRAVVPVQPVDWWTALGDPQLDRLMEAALADNPTLAEAQARVRLAEATLAGSRAGRLPQISASVDITRERLSEKAPIPPPYGGQTLWIGSALADLSWSLDLAGRQAALIEQAGAEVQVAALNAAAARVALSGALAQAYVNLVRAEEQIALARRFHTSRQETLALEKSRYRNQLSSLLDERAAATLLAEARQAEVRAEGDRERMLHALAALVGRGADLYPTITAPTLRLEHSLTVPDALPADLLARRPDILAAQARVRAATAGRKVARAAFYPNVDLRAFAGLSAVGLGDLFGESARTYGVGPAIHLPIFQGGRLTADYEGATASIDVMIARYNDQLVQAVREVADALSDIRTADADADAQREVLSSLADTVRLDDIRIRAGLISRLDTIASGERLLRARQDEVNIAADRTLRRIQLIVALGGGFQPLADDNMAAATTIAGEQP